VVRTFFLWTGQDMYTFLIVVITALALLLCVIILMQSGKGGGLAAEFGGASSSTDSFIGGRQAANVLTRATWILGGAFMGLALLLGIMTARRSAPVESILRSEFEQAAPTGQPTSVLDTEQQTPTGVETQPADGPPADTQEPEGDGN